MNVDVYDRTKGVGYVNLSATALAPVTPEWNIQTRVSWLSEGQVEVGTNPNHFRYHLRSK